MSLAINELQPNMFFNPKKGKAQNVWNNDIYMGLYHQVGTRDGRQAGMELNPNAHYMMMTDKQLRMKLPPTVQNMKPRQG